MSDPKNIVFLMSDQHRLDSVSYAGEWKVPTPNIDRIAESVAFTNCSSVNPICTPARCCLLTGKYSHQIGMLAMSGDLSPQHPTFMRGLQRAGYYTAGVGKFHWLQGWGWGRERGKGHDLVALSDRIKQFGLDYAWETSGKQLALRNYCDYCKYLDDKGLLEAFRDHVESRGGNTSTAAGTQFTGEPWPFDEADYVDVVTGDKIVEAIRNRPTDRPMFLFGSFCSPHMPFDPPARYLEATPPDETDDFIVAGEAMDEDLKRRMYRIRRAYRAMIRLVDDQVGRVFEALDDEGILDETVIVMTSDHGEMLGDRAGLQKQRPYRSSISVPCAIRHPDRLERKLNNSPVEITDLTATMLDVAGLDPVESLARGWPQFGERVPARSLMPIVDGAAERVRDFAFAECESKWQMIRDERWLYVRRVDYDEPGGRTEELYDRVGDPDELENLAGEPGVAEDLQTQRDRCDFVMDTTPPAQLRWAPIIGEDDAPEPR